MAPVAVVLAGIILHAGFSVNAGSGSVVLGGAVADAPSTNVAQAAELTASDFIGDADILDDTIHAQTNGNNSAVAADGVFTGSAHAHVDGVQVHVIGPGETLYSIATRYGVDQRALARANKAVSDVLIVGDELVIPASRVAGTGQMSPRRTLGNYLPKGFIWPIAGRITVGQPHGHTDSQTGELIARDIPSPLGTPILASGVGTVIEASYNWNGGYGNRVIVDHGDVQTLYAHMSDILVHEGEQVSQGQVIGLVGNTGHSTGPHVHFEVRWLWPLVASQ